MALAISGSATSAADTGGIATTASQNMDLGSLANSCVFIFSTVSNSGTITGVTVGGVAATLVSSQGIAQLKLYLHKLVNPGTGTKSVVVTANATANYPAFAAVCYGGVNQTTPNGTPSGTAAATSPVSQSVTTASDSISLAAAAAASYPSTLAWTSGHTARGSTPRLGGTSSIILGDKAGTGGSVAASLTNSGPSYMALINVNVNAATGSPFSVGAVSAALTHGLALSASTTAIKRRIWRLPATGFSNGTVRRLVVLADDSLTVINTAAATASGGNFEIAATGADAVGAVRRAYIDNWDGNTSSTNIRGGVGLATKVEL